jgi:Domain of unknown function (DUF4440)
MISIARWLKLSLAAMPFFLTGIDSAAKQPSSGEPPAPCAAPAYRQFDFWAGDWDVFDVGNPIQVAHAQVHPILDGCVLREDYQGVDGHKGQSFTIYDAARNVWHQSWVTNRGQLLEIEGRIEAGQMTLSGQDQATGALVRGTWRPQNGDVRETAATSADGGKTWKPWFDLVFRRKTSDAGISGDDDKKIVAALDTEYQAAVKENDAVTMDRILAENFVLATGSGKIYTKTDLLAEARSRRLHYDRQDDTDQMVRVWGDTAVVTARLMEKGTNDGKPFEYEVWFSDTYVRTPLGWQYAFGQASLPLPKGP